MRVGASPARVSHGADAPIRDTRGSLAILAAIRPIPTPSVSADVAPRPGPAIFFGPGRLLNFSNHPRAFQFAVGKGPPRGSRRGRIEIGRSPYCLQPGKA